MALSRDGILAAADIKTQEIDVPEWGGTVFIKGMSGAERDQFEASNRRSDGEQNLTNVRARFLVRCIVNENGTRIFADQDAAALGKKSSSALTRLWEAANEANGTSAEAQEETEGNSEPEGGSDSPSN